MTDVALKMPQLKQTDKIQKIKSVKKKGICIITPLTIWMGNILKRPQRSDIWRETKVGPN